jgi:hypothetical protein
MMGPQAAPPDPMTAIALRSLRDIAEPAPVSWMPQTWGWAMVASILLLQLLLIVLSWRKRHRANAYRREALAILGGIEESFRNPATRQNGVHDLAELLKRVAIAGWERRGIAPLSGGDWVRFLGAHGGDEVARRLQCLLDDLEYHGGDSLGALPEKADGDLTAAARQWIEQHHVPT